MGINVQLRSENGEVFDEVFDCQMTLSKASLTKLSGTRLLKYVVPWGDAIFNQAQAGDLAIDVREMMQSCVGTPLFEILAKIEPLIERLACGTHLYLWFVGD